MSVIPFARALHLLKSCSGLIVESQILFPELSNHAAFLVISWEMAGIYFEYEFHEEENRLVTIEDGAMVLIDSDGAVFSLVLLTRLSLDKA